MKNYIDFLSREDIEKILKENDLVLTDDILDRNGDDLPAIVKSDESIFIRCKKLPNEKDNSIKKEIFRALGKKAVLSHLLFANSSIDAYNNTIVIIENFTIYILSVDYQEDGSDEKLANTFYDFMADKFGKEYINDLKKYYNKVKKHQKEESKESSL